MHRLALLQHTCVHAAAAINLCCLLPLPQSPAAQVVDVLIKLRGA
jgi:hypothetical protein